MHGEVCIRVVCQCVWASCEFFFFFLSLLSHSFSQYLFEKEKGHRCGNRRGHISALEFTIIPLPVVVLQPCA